eukprot:m.80471 g.80471  ORF g.80471 m.80471 type:complete len:362 (-) comp10907_c0_seq2:98-1183(-)
MNRAKRVHVGWVLSQILKIEENEHTFEWRGEIFLRASWNVEKRGNERTLYAALVAVRDGFDAQPTVINGEEVHVLEKENAYKVKQVWWPKLFFANIQHPLHDNILEERFIFKGGQNANSIEMWYETRLMGTFNSGLRYDASQNARLHVEVISQHPLDTVEMEVFNKDMACVRTPISSAYGPREFDILERDCQTIDEFCRDDIIEERSSISNFMCSIGMNQHAVMFRERLYTDYRRHTNAQIFLVARVKRRFRFWEFFVEACLFAIILVGFAYTYQLHQLTSEGSSTLTNALSFIVSGLVLFIFALRELLGGKIPHRMRTRFVLASLCLGCMVVVVLWSTPRVSKNDLTSSQTTEGTGHHQK